MTNRSSNFTADQIELLLDSLEACPQLATGKLGGKIPTKHHQRLAWEAVAQKINEIGYGSVKNGAQIRSKWHDLKYRLRQKSSKLFQRETGIVPSEEALTRLDKRALYIMNWASSEPLTDKSFDSSAKVLPANVLEVLIGNAEETHDAITPDNALKEIANCASTNICSENLNDSSKEIEAAAENASCEALENDWSSRIVIQEIQSESVVENASNTENGDLYADSAVETTCNWPFVTNKPNSSTARAKVFRAKKRKLLEDEEDSFEKRAITTQERMATDINEIKDCMIEMKNNMKRYMERIDQKFDKMLELLGVALNVEPDELKK